MHSLNSLECGTRYEIYMTADNKIGTGNPSEVYIISTNGSGKIEVFYDVEEHRIITECIDHTHRNAWP